jgi:hypothetical protein
MLRGPVFRRRPHLRSARQILGIAIDGGARKVVVVICSAQVAAFATALLAGGLSTLVPWHVVPSGGQLASRRALCDQAVSTLLKTGDLIELQRADFLFRQLDRSITQRV